MTTLIIGANGKIGRLVVQELVEAGEQPLAMVRSSEQEEELRAMGADTVVGNLEGNFEPALIGCNRVVFTAGSGASTGADKTILVDLWGAMRAVDAAVTADVEHFVMVSSRGAEDPDNGPEKIKHYNVCKRLADDHLVRSGLNYTILRPGRLLDEPATGRLTTEWPVTPDEQCITRADVAKAVAYSLKHQQTRGKIYPLFQGTAPLEEVLV
jgi:uncharacterized protein YbjT (DUF2867 family)